MLKLLTSTLVTLSAGVAVTVVSPVPPPEDVELLVLVPPPPPPPQEKRKNNEIIDTWSDKKWPHDMLSEVEWLVKEQDKIGNILKKGNLILT
jgi:hypothetical protein